MCQNCLGEFTVSMAYVKKDLNVLDKAALIAKLPVTTDHKNNVTARVDLVLKEDIAGTTTHRGSPYSRAQANERHKCPPPNSLLCHESEAVHRYLF